MSPASPSNLPTTLIALAAMTRTDQLHKHKVRIFKDIHVSGHASREDLRDLINLVQPTHIIPAHGNIKMRSGIYQLAGEMGYDTEKFVHLCSDGSKVVINK